jgi:hypothetical protein
MTRPPLAGDPRADIELQYSPVSPSLHLHRRHRLLRETYEMRDRERGWIKRR